MSKKKKLIIIALSAAAVFILAVFLILYCNGYSGLHTHSRAEDGQIKVACVGDSITYGHGIKWWARNNYPAELQKLLGDEYHVQNFGHSGRTLSPKGDQPYVQSKQYELSIEYDADIVVFMLGTNDTKPENWEGILEFMEHYDEMIISYKENNPDVRIILCTPANALYPDGKNEGKTNYDIQPEHLDDIANYIRTYALANSYELVDVYALSKYHDEWFEADNVHPSNDGADAIAKLIAEKIK